jgi:protein O-mannosyl-transferase
MSIIRKYKNYFLLFFLVGIIIYFPIFLNGFVWDDLPTLINNPQVHQINLITIFGNNSFNDGLFYRPITALYDAVLYSIFGQQAFFYHFIQLILHIIDTCLLFLLFIIFFSEGLSAVLAFLFLVHPVNVESVAYISSINNELALLFTLSAILLATTEHINLRKLLGVSALLVLGLFSKEAALPVLPAILTLRYLLKSNKLKAFAIVDAGVLALYVLLKVLSGSKGYGYTWIAMSRLSLQERLINIPAIIIYYMKTFIFPLQLAIRQVWIIRSIELTTFILPLIICFVLFISVALFIRLLYRQQKSHTQSIHTERTALLFFAIWFIFSIIPILQIVPLDETVADRWFYFPIIGLLGIVGTVIQSAKLKPNSKSFIIGAVIILSLLSLRTFTRTFNWKDNITLDSHDIQINNDSYTLNDDLGALLFLNGQHSQALEYEQKSVSLFPNPQNQSNLASMYLFDNQDEKAIQTFYNAIQSATSSDLNTVSSTTTSLSKTSNTLDNDYDELSRLLLIANRPSDAIALLNTKGLKQFPGDYRLYTTLAIAEEENHNHPKALEAISKAIQLSHDPQVNLIYNQINNSNNKKSNTGLTPTQDTQASNWKRFTNSDMNITFIYPPTFQITQINPHYISVSDPNNPGNDNELLIYSNDINWSSNQIYVPFHIEGQFKSQSQTQIAGLPAVTQIFGNGSRETRLIQIKNGQQLIAVRPPVTVNPSQGIKSKTDTILSSLQTLNHQNR